MAEGGLGQRPGLDLVEDAGARVDEGQEIGGDNDGEDLKACQGEILQGKVEDQLDDPRYDGAEAAEHKPAKKEVADGAGGDGRVFHSLMCILSFTFLSCLRET